MSQACVESPRLSPVQTLGYGSDHVTTACRQVSRHQQPTTAANVNHLRHGNVGHGFSASLRSLLPQDDCGMRSMPLPVDRRQANSDELSYPYASAPAVLAPASSSTIRVYLQSHLQPLSHKLATSAAGSGRERGASPTGVVSSCDSLTVKGNVSAGLFCTQCGSFLRNPVQIPECGHRYCHMCAISLIESKSASGLCKLDNTTFRESDLRSDRQASKELPKLTVYCSARHQGCSWEGPWEDLQEHVGGEFCHGRHGCHGRPLPARQNLPRPQVPTSRPAPTPFAPSPCQPRTSASAESPRQPSASATAGCDCRSEIAELRRLVQSVRDHATREIQNQTVAIRRQEEATREQQQKAHKQFSETALLLQEQNGVLRQELLKQKQSAARQMEQIADEHRLQLQAQQAQINELQQQILSVQMTSASLVPYGSAAPGQGRRQSAVDGDCDCRFAVADAGAVGGRCSLLSIDSGLDVEAMTSPPVRSTCRHVNILPLQQDVSELQDDTSDLRMRVELMEHCTNNGHFVWKISDFSQRMTEAIDGTTTSLYSPHFFTHPQGYKMCLRMYPHGDGTAKGTHLSLFVVVMESHFDAILPWPMMKKIVFRIWDQSVPMPEHRVEKFGTKGGSGSSFTRPAGPMNVASGVPKMMSHDLLQPGSQFLKNDTLFVECCVTDLPQRQTVRSQ